MNQKALKSIMRLFALAKQFNLQPGADENAKDIVHVFLLEYTNPAEESMYMDIFEYHGATFGKREHTSKSLSLFSIKATIICTNIVESLPKNIRIHLVLSILEVLKFKCLIEQNSYDLVRTISTIFHIQSDELNDMLSFVDITKEYWGDNIIVISSDNQNIVSSKKVINEQLFAGNLHVLFNRATHALFFYHDGEREFFLRNGSPINSRRIYGLRRGGVIENYKFQPLFYGKLLAYFSGAEKPDSIELVIDNISYRFPDGGVALHPITFTVRSGEMIGVMGNSGTGKSTLLNLLAGTLKPTTGGFLINGHDLYSLGNNLLFLVGHIHQDDMLIRELTVYQNLYFTARLCFQEKSPQETAKMVLYTLEELGLDEIKHLRVGTPEKSIISGGQRKRLNMAMEFIRKPQILFVDEPTSGLSSIDSEKVIDIIKNQTQQGKLALVNIHQPSSTIFKMFDKILILDSGGRAVFFGNPLDALVHFKTATFQVNSMERECPACGNVNPEQILDIIEQRTLKPDGLPTDQRKYSPESWYNIFLDTNKGIINEPIKKNLPKQTVVKVSSLRQLSIFLKRNFLSVLSDKQFLLISLIEAPLLAFMLAFLAKNFGGNDLTKGYSFFYNQNIPAYMLMSVVVAMFFGLMVGAERIIRDRHIIQREKFLGLSRLSYINSKILFLFVFLMVQITLFVVIGNIILGIRENGLIMWVILLSVAINGGVLGLNLSSGLRTTVAIYISIPILLMPQFLLNGSLIPFDKLHRSIASHGDVPLVANLAVSRWGYEALLVDQFMNNRYQKLYSDIDNQESQLKYMNGYLIPEIVHLIQEFKINSMNDTIEALKQQRLIIKGIEQLNVSRKIIQIAHVISKNPEYSDTLLFQLGSLKRHIASDISNLNMLKDQRTSAIVKSLGSINTLIELKEKNSNEAVSDLVLARKESMKIIRTDDGFIRKFEPIFKEPDLSNGNAHFLSAVKKVGRFEIDTLWFNLVVIWLLTGILYIALYFDWLKKINTFFMIK